MFVASYRHTERSAKPNLTPKGDLWVSAQELRRMRAEKEAALRPVEARDDHVDAIVIPAPIVVTQPEPVVADQPYRITQAIIERRICRALKVSKVDVRSKRRLRKIVLAKQAIAYWTYRLTNRSLPEIGRLLGGRDHTTVLHSMRKYPEKRAEMGRYLRPARDSSLPQGSAS